MCISIERSQWVKYKQIGYFTSNWMHVYQKSLHDLQKSLILIYADINDAENR